MQRLAVIMPVYNEQATVERAVARILTAPIDMDIRILAVDDASTDGSFDLLTRMAAADPRITVLHHTTNRGKGAAVRTAIASLPADADIALIHDADLEYDPADYPRLVGPIRDGRADAVFGSRFIGSDAHRVLYFWHAIGNRVVTVASNMLTNLNLTDMECCLKAFRADVVRRLDLREDRFGIEPELVARAAKAGARVFEVGVSYAGRTYAEGKKIRWTDGFDAIRAMIGANLRR
jgi:glycosyltransferase involved in cell wall biosynthesis